MTGRGYWNDKQEKANRILLEQAEDPSGDLPAPQV